MSWTNRIRPFKFLFQSMLFLLIVLTCFGASAHAFGQSSSTSASINGTVADEAGGKINGATITARNLQTNFSRETRTVDDGSFLFNQLPAGSYELTVMAAGFAAKT